MLESINGIERAIRGKSYRDYQRVDGRIIWNAVKNELPPLKAALLALKASLGDA
jgi:uncharacterized protein with HEPN domain